ncbi:MAG: hypothetical protein QF567_00360 [Candidatus Pacearchaeota archaeon]|jgi:hypothetical protein|nr:hypothetical protein [Candidatus Pacearchaeota archaeon]MDP7520674.1 hypothetical protein [Candidatus Pacearchaeota archaeon]|tara:strand:- start:115 stop:576 length:462 start_codon:yes stop_codon:yes gene_type:complete
MKKILPLSFLVLSLMLPNFSLGKTISPEKGLAKKKPFFTLRSPIPLRFSNYVSRSFKEGIVILNDTTYHAHRYFLDNDGFSEVMEFYPFIKDIESISKGITLKHGIHVSRYPKMYFFDKDDNNRVDNGEFLKDPMVNGLNGDEYWLRIDKPKR